MPTPGELATAAADVDRLLLPAAELVDIVAPLVADDASIVTPASALGASELTDDERLLQVLEHTDASVLAARQAIDRIRRSWRYRDDPTALARTELDRRIAELAAAEAWPEAVLADADDLTGTIAVPPRSAFDPLQRSVIPASATVVPGTDRPTATVIAADTVGSAIDAATGTTDEPTAFVATGRTKSQLQAVVRAHQRPPGELRPYPDWDPFLALLSAVATPGEPRVGPLRETISSLGIATDDIDDHRTLDAIDGEAAVWLSVVTADTANLTVANLREQYAFRSGRRPSTAPIDALGVADAEVTRAIVGDLRAFIDETRRSQPGTGRVLDGATAWGTSAPSLAIVDPGRDWLRQPPPGLTKRWVEQEQARLSLLCSSAEACTVYTTPASGSPDAWFEVVQTTDAEEPERPAAPPVEFSPERRPRRGHDRFTKSQLNRLLAAPRDALFGDVLSRPARRSLTRGSAIHDYADLLVGAPAAVDTIGRDRVKAWIADELDPLVPSHRRHLVDARLEAAMAVVEAYLADLTPPPEALEGYSSPRWLDNAIADAFEVAIERTVTEQYFRDDDLGISGLVDLIRSPTHLVDFKTGTPLAVEGIVDRGLSPESSRRPDVQLPLYLAALRRQRTDQPLQMTFVFSHGALPASLAGEPDLPALSRTVHYYPESVATWLTHTETVDRLAAATPADHPRARLCSVVSRRQLTDALGELADGGTPAAVVDRLAAAGADQGLQAVVAQAGARSLVSAARRWRDQRVFGDELDRFVAALDRWRERRNRYDREGYPFGDPLEAHLDFPALHTDRSPIAGGDHS